MRRPVLRARHSGSRSRSRPVTRRQRRGSRAPTGSKGARRRGRGALAMSRPAACGRRGRLPPGALDRRRRPRRAGGHRPAGGSRSADAYSVAMSRGFAERPPAGTTRRARPFGQALALRPGSREAKDAIAALDQGQQASPSTCWNRARAPAEGAERWDEALGAWREAAEPRAFARIRARWAHARDAARGTATRGSTL